MTNAKTTPEELADLAALLAGARAHIDPMQGAASPTNPEAVQHAGRLVAMAACIVSTLTDRLS